ncbi:MAG: glycerol kinase GlpK [Sphaerochaetaceae bacterium]
MFYVGSLDQGTTSTRFFLFDNQGKVVASSQLEHKQFFPQPGWVEHDASEIWENSVAVISQTLKKIKIKITDIKGLGITNQRETIVAWEPESGKIRHNAIVWQDLRGTELINKIKETEVGSKIAQITGLVPSPYFSAAKIAWLLDNDDSLKKDAQNGKVIFGTIDTFLVWNLTGGPKKGRIVTDATNASRYMLMDIETLCWSDELLDLFEIPKTALPEIVSSFGEVYGYTTNEGPFGTEVAVGGILGDQQAALFGQACFKEGQCKSTYGTGCFLLANTGENLYRSKRGLLSTVAYKEYGKKAVYALEGSIAVAGSLVQWARDNLKLVKSASELDQKAMEVDDCGGVYIVPAFSGLFAPYWRSDARGVIAGLTGYVTTSHICRAILEATAFQVKDIFDAMQEDAKLEIASLKVDGGMTNSRPLMEFQADLLGIPVIRPDVFETTALGAAYAAGLSVGLWNSLDELTVYWKEKSRWLASMDQSVREKKILFWNKAIERTLNWETE